MNEIEKKNLSKRDTGMKNLRSAALDILTDVIQNGCPLTHSIDVRLGVRDFTDKRARSFIMRLVYTTLENIYLADFILEGFLKQPLKRMKPLVRIILEMSVVQIMFMDGVPDRAVCDEAVRLTSERGFAGLKGVVNGTLRNIIRNKNSIKLPKLNEDCKNIQEYISVNFSLPPWLSDMWCCQFGEEKALEIAEAIRSPQKTFIRINTMLTNKKDLIMNLESEKITVNEIDEEGLSDIALSIEGFDSSKMPESFKKGYFYIQDLSSMMSGIISDFKGGDCVLDLCAAPGGKTINAFLIMQSLGGGRIDACDITDKKTKLIHENIKRLKLPLAKDDDDFGITVRESDAYDYHKEFEQKYDVVIADVPCSGLGIIRRKPDIILHTNPEKINQLRSLQRKIIDNAVKYVRPGGRFIFSTCTLNKYENEENAKYIEETHFLNKYAEMLLFPSGTKGSDGFYTACFCKERNK